MNIDFEKLRMVCGYKTYRGDEEPLGCDYQMEPHSICDESVCPLKSEERVCDCVNKFYLEDTQKYCQECGGKVVLE